MQSFVSLSSISSATSSNSSMYAFRTIIEAKDLPSAAPRCRSSLVMSHDNDQTFFSTAAASTQFPAPSPRPRDRLSAASKSKIKCRHLFRTCFSATSSTLSLPTQPERFNAAIRKQYFFKLCQNYRLLLVLNDYECRCGCHFSMRQGSYVILYERKVDLSMWNKGRRVTVISNELVCSRVPSEYVCDVALLRERVRSRHFSSDDEQSFDL